MSNTDKAFKSNQDRRSCNELHSRPGPVALSIQYTSGEKEQYGVAEVKRKVNFPVYPI